jgi:hypothetical protein
MPDTCQGEALMAIARAAATYQLLDLKGLVRLAGLRFLPADFRDWTLRFLVRLLNMYSSPANCPADFVPFTKSHPNPA